MSIGDRRRMVGNTKTLITASVGRAQSGSLAAFKTIGQALFLLDAVGRFLLCRCGRYGCERKGYLRRLVWIQGH